MTKPNTAFSLSNFALVAAAVFVYFFGLTIPLVGPDEPRYAQVAREMFERGDWITPTLGGFNWFEKPALLYWLQIASFNIFGVSEFAARFGSALFGLGTVASLWILGRHLDKQAGGDLAGWLALIAASTVGIIAFAHGASFDIVLTFPITAAMVSYYIFDTGGRRTAPLLCFYFFIGLALLAKGLVGIIFPLAIVGFYQLLSWKLPPRKFALFLIWGTALAIAVASLWYLPMYRRHGHEFIDQFFIQHHFQRFTSNKYQHPQPFYFFFWVLPLMTIPWLPFFVAGLWSFAKSLVRRVTRDQEVSPLALFAFAWLAVPVVFFSFSGSKLPGYILPAVPAAIIIATQNILRFVEVGQWRRYFVKAIAGGTFVAVIAAILLLVPRFAEADSVKSLFAAADERGFGETPVLLLHGVSHNAEFYAPGRIIREANGKQKKALGPPDVGGEIQKRENKPLLVLVPLEYLYQLLESEFLDAEVLKDNGELALVLVRAS